MAAVGGVGVNVAEQYYFLVRSERLKLKRTDGQAPNLIPAIPKLHARLSSLRRRSLSRSLDRG